MGLGLTHHQFPLARHVISPHQWKQEGGVGPGSNDIEAAQKIKRLPAENFAGSCFFISIFLLTVSLLQVFN